MPPLPPQDAETRIDQYTGPYERWVFTEELGKPFAFPLIARGGSRRYTALMEGGSAPQSSETMRVRLPPLWRAPDQELQITPFVFESLLEDGTPPQDTIAQCLSSVAAQCAQAGGDIAPRFRVNFPVVDETWVADYDPEADNPDWVMPKTPPKAIIGVIDDGLPFANRAFLNSEGQSRVSYCWLQSGMAAEPAQVPFGREYTNDEIDTLRADFGQDELSLYRGANAVNPRVFELGNGMMRHATHGSHVMGLAAGNASLFPDHPMGDDIQIIAVQLPNTIAWDTSGFGKEMYMLSAIHYVFERASRIARAFDMPELPLILNFSYGWSAGRHDGHSEMEIAIQDLLDARKTIQPVSELVMPTGNNFSSDMHARFIDDDFDGDTLSFGWHLQPDDQTSSYLEMWLPADFDPEGYRVTLTGPPGLVFDEDATLDISAEAQDGGDPRRYLNLVSGGQIIGQMSADRHRNDRWRVMIALIPTIYTRDEPRRAPSGTYTVTLHRTAQANRLAEAEGIKVWVQRDDDPSDLKSLGRQSTLTNLANGGADAGRPGSVLQTMTPALTPFSGYGALNAVASSPLTTRVAGFTDQTRRVSYYSGSGGIRRKPDGSLSVWGAHTDVIAISDESAMLPGISSTGVLSGSRARLIGTSCAAPSVARLMALNAARGLPVFDGMEAALQLPEVETKGRDQAEIEKLNLQHTARVGQRTAPVIVKRG